mgnify:CR=1 FL=1
MSLTLEQVKRNEEVRAYIQKADESLIVLGYTEHSFAHVTKTAVTAARQRGEPQRPRALGRADGL